MTMVSCLRDGVAGSPQCPVHFEFDGDAVLDAAREQNNNLAVPNLAIVSVRFSGYDPAGGHFLLPH